MFRVLCAIAQNLHIATCHRPCSHVLYGVPFNSTLILRNWCKLFVFFFRLLTGRIDRRAIRVKAWVHHVLLGWTGSRLCNRARAKDGADVLAEPGYKPAIKKMVTACVKLAPIGRASPLSQKETTWFRYGRIFYINGVVFAPFLTNSSLVFGRPLFASLSLE